MVAFVSDREAVEDKRDNVNQFSVKFFVEVDFQGW